MPTANHILKRLAGFLLDIRTLQAVAQIVFVIIVVVVLAQTADNMLTELRQRNLTPTFNFLQNRAGFELSDSDDYTPSDTYREAFLVGVRNTVKVVSTGLALTTILGVLVGLCLLSNNWLVRNIARVYVEILRNTPLLVQLFVWFYVVLLSLPPIRDSVQIPGEGLTVIPLRWLVDALLVAALFQFKSRLAEESLERMLLPVLVVLVIVVLEILNAFPIPVARLELTPLAYISNRGVALPALMPTERFLAWLATTAAGVLAAAGVAVYLRRRSEITERRYPRTTYAALIVLAAALIGWLVAAAPPAPETVTVEQDGEQVTLPLEEARAQELLTEEDEARYAQTPLLADVPRRQGLRYAGGMVLLPEYTALLLGLVVYTSAFIAEIVRAGILAVPHGQIEASRALGLSYSQSLQLIVLPQALRVIIPPLGNQYLNLAKNSSLAIAISFTDVFQVTGTIINQTGQSVSGILMVMATYLIMSLIIAAVMNVMNRRFQLVTR